MVCLVRRRRRRRLAEIDGHKTHTLCSCRATSLLVRRARAVHDDEPHEGTRARVLMESRSSRPREPSPRRTPSAKLRARCMDCGGPARVVVYILVAKRIFHALDTRVSRLLRRPQSRRDHPLNLSILLSGGKETNQDFLSSGERTGKSPAPNPAVPPQGNVVFGRIRLTRGVASRPSPS